ncbi:MAG TPA: UvrD-helicase domain-containing protein, partial [Immundisolibacter sp.]|nr:UvrD-helicase domain-containing protein [Immundisolibacter sp.]
MSLPLDPLTLPLAGRHLIEASAGTGKTWTIAALYLRQLLQNRREPGQMLVVTFTEAAAAELRERIAARLLEARDALAGLPATDDFLASLVNGVPDRSAASAHLDDALLRLDELAVHTIHGFCGRVLADHAFSAGSRFEADIETDLRPLTAEILGDFWRRQCAVADPVLLDVLYGLWPQGPQSLAKALKNLAGRPGLRLLPPASAVDPAARQAALDGAAQAFVAAWSAGRDEVFALLIEHTGLSRSDKSGYKPDALEALFEDIDAWVAQPQGLPPASIRRLSPVALDAALTATARKKGIAAPTHPLLDAAAAVAVAGEALTQALHVHTVHAALAYLRAQSESRLVERGRRGFDSLLQELAAALDGPGGPALASTLASRYPVVMIDEFQDTDPLQYGLFERMHRAAAEGFGLYLIGDPKQAIYQFRGADVFAYLAARNGVPPAQRHTLTTNQRSTGRLVRAVNALFGRHRRPFVLDAPGQEIEFYEV